MSQNSLPKVAAKGNEDRDWGHRPSAPPNYRTPTPVKVPPPTKGK